METYRATLRPLSATRSPWQADTVFGHLCWIIRYEQGEDALDEFLTQYRDGSPPLILSNGFPDGWLPRPIMPIAGLPATRTKEATVAAMKQAKVGKGVRWVSVEHFNDARRGEIEGPIRRPNLSYSRTVLKNQINRLTGGTTPVDEDSGGNLYNVDELAWVDTSAVERAGVDVVIYVKARDEAWARRAEELLMSLSRSGYGAKKSAGYGHFELVDWSRFGGFDNELPDANAFISLSNWVPARNDPINGYYTTMVKYGKLGVGFTPPENPFKFPLIMLTAGSSFYTEPPIGDWYGKLVQGIAPADDRVVQYGYAFAVPAVLPEEVIA